MIPTQGRRGDRQARRFAIAAVLAVAVHALLLLLLGLWGHFFPPSPRAPRVEPQAIALRALSADEWAKNRGRNAPPPIAATKPVEKKPEPETGQVVTTAPGNRQESEDAKLLAETSHKVDKQTLAKDRTAFFKNPMPRRSAPTPPLSAERADSQPVEQNPQLGKPEADHSAGEAAKAAKEIPDIEERDRLALRDDRVADPTGVTLKNRSASERMRGNSSRLLVRPGEDDGAETGASNPGPTGNLRLLPSASAMEEILGGAANDHVEDVEDGDATFLNTREWRFASFFNRIRESVGTQWNPGARMRVRDPTGEIYGSRDRQTVLAVTLDANGRLVEAEVVKSSGLEFLDLEAVQSFERAQPFPNPPPGLLTADSTVRFQFGFFLELGGGGPKLRIYRGPN